MILIFGFLISLATAITAEGCLVPCNEIISGGPPKDGIPAIDSPRFISATDFEAKYDSEYLAELYVVGIVVNGVSRAYPRDILNWHEICNDEIGDSPFSVTFCPLTGSAIAYDTTPVAGSTLGTTGRLYENNLVFYTRNSDEWYSQMLGVILKGGTLGAQLPLLPVIETTWTSWKALHPDTDVLSRTTGYPRNYDSTPYPGYRERSEIWFPTSYAFQTSPYNLYHAKALTLVLNLDSQTYLYPYEELAKSPVVNHHLSMESGIPIVIVQSVANNLVIPFNASISSSVTGDTNLTFAQANSADFDKSETLGLPVFTDNQTGSFWNFRGEAFQGPLLGTTLTQVPAYSAFWFAATSLYPGSIIYQTTGEIQFDTPLDGESQQENSFNTPGLPLIVGIPGLILLASVIRHRKRSGKKQKQN